MGGPQDSKRNVTWWDEALTEARKHGDPFLEAMVLKTMGYACPEVWVSPLLHTSFLDLDHA